MTDEILSNNFDACEATVLGVIAVLVGNASADALERAQVAANVLLTVEQARAARSTADDMTT